MIVNPNINQKCYIIFEVIMGVSLIITLGFACLSFKSIDQSDNGLQDLTSNWQSSPIMNFTTVGLLESCPTGYSRFLNMSWPGTNAGCDCNSIYSTAIPETQRNRLNSGICSLNQANVGCRAVKPNSAVSYRVWKGGIICAQRANASMTYESLKSREVGPNSTCTNGTRQCGVLDTVGNKLCLPPSQACPINKVVFAYITDPIPTDYNYQSIALNSMNTLYYTSEAVTENLLLQFRLSEEGKVCQDPKQYNTNMTQFELDVDYANYGCTSSLPTAGKYDTRYKMIDSALKQNFYSGNGISLLLILTPYYPLESLDTTVGLYNRPFVGLQGNCTFDTSYVNDMAVKVDRVGYFKAGTAFFAVLTFLYFLFQAYCKHKVITASNVRTFNCLEFGVILGSFFTFCIVIMALLANSGFASMSTFTCGDPILNEGFVELAKELGKTTNDYYVLLLSLLNIAGYFISYLACCLLSRVQVSTDPLALVAAHEMSHHNNHSMNNSINSSGMMNQPGNNYPQTNSNNMMR
jgi:hypothetical protein